MPDWKPGDRVEVQLIEDRKRDLDRWYPGTVVRIAEPTCLGSPVVEVDAEAWPDYAHVNLGSPSNGERQRTYSPASPRALTREDDHA